MMSYGMSIWQDDAGLRLNFQYSRYRWQLPATILLKTYPRNSVPLRSYPELQHHA